MTTKVQTKWRRAKVLEMVSKGNSQTDIARILQIHISIVNRDISHLKRQAIANIQKYVNERLPEEYERCLVGLNAITKEAWDTADNTEDKREKIQALSLAKDCYAMKLELLTNAQVIDDAIRFVGSQHHANSATIAIATTATTANDANDTTAITTTNEIF